MITPMGQAEPLSSDEEALWRAVMRITRVLPRYLDSDLVRNGGLTASEIAANFNAVFLEHLQPIGIPEMRMKAQQKKEGRKCVTGDR